VRSCCKANSNENTNIPESGINTDEFTEIEIPYYVGVRENQIDANDYANVITSEREVQDLYRYRQDEDILRSNTLLLPMNFNRQTSLPSYDDAIRMSSPQANSQIS